MEYPAQIGPGSFPAAKLAFKAHPHMLRHACGYALANKGHDTRALQAYLGTRFRDFWRE